MKWAWLVLGTVAVIAVVAAVAVGLPAGEDHGPGITIHTEGTFDEVREILRDEHRLWLTYMGVPDQDTPIKLDLHNATMHQLARAVAEQMGATYRISGGGLSTNIMLYEGDLNLDPRPTTAAGPYKVFISEIDIARGGTIEFRLGEEAPDIDQHRSLAMTFDVEPPDAEAEELLFGVWPQASIVLDTGERLTNGAGVARSYPVRMLDPGSGRSHLGLNFPLPEGSPTRITLLKGVVAAFRSTSHPSCQFTPDEVGTTKQLGDVGCKLASWEVLEEWIEISVELPADVGSLEDKCIQPRAELLGPDGASTGAGSRGSQGGSAGYVYTFRFPLVDWEPTGIVVKATIWHGPLKWHNFTIEDIPLP